jgi:hypothetical protein
VTKPWETCAGETPVSASNDVPACQACPGLWNVFVFCFQDRETFDLVGKARVCNSVGGEEPDGGRSVLTTM